MRRANIVREAKIIHVAVSALLTLCGIAIWAFPQMDDTVVRYLLGVGFCVMGAACVLGYFANDLYRLAFQFDLATGIFCVILGVLIFVQPGNLTANLPIAIGIYILLDGLLRMQTALDARAFGMKQWGGLLASALLVGVCGVTVLIVGAFFPQAQMLVGVALTLDGGEHIWNTMGTVRVRAKKKQKYEDELR